MPSKSFKRFLLDRGHGENNTRAGLYDPGATHGDRSEAKLVDALALALCLYWRRETPSLLIVPNDLSIGGVIRYANSHHKPGDALLSLHMNDSGGKGASGCEVIIAATAPPERREEAQTIVDTVSSRLGIPNRGVKLDSETPRKRLPLLRNTTAPAYILECGFVDSDKDVAAIRQRGVSAIAAALRALAGDA